METPENNKPTNNKKLYMALGAIGLILLVVSILFFVQNKEMTSIVENLNEEKTILTEEYQNLMVNYDSLYSDNDTLNLMLEAERERISQLVEEIKTIKATNTAKIREFQKELTTLRGVLRNYIVQIDSLNQRNMELTEENLEHRRRYTQIASSYRELEEVKSNLEEKVTIASRLDVTNMMAEGLTPSGRKTERSGRIGKIRVCFTLLKNVTSPVGMKEFFLRIERPDGQLLMHSRDNTFEHEGSDINYSATRSVEYGGEELDVCLFYDADAGELISGEYIADVFADGFHLKSLRFTLR
ncbi:hypothetical protein [Geofilum rubicundum]|uniref:Uncharacterized protein n=1 Tax=Geofilum rubicundum JCM 15548 TaxID=1236989 RepID=A0A0E9LSZ0_9BACT|nr:hypothetical protein [Geofilum rubicundum]GAO27960.1 hypothetical protein JCM15548_8 [Geofilum rubicundum JCM 15548]